MPGGVPALHPERKGALNISPKSNWVEKRGGLPPYINSLATHFVSQGLDRSRAIARAVGVIKRACATGVWPGIDKPVSPAVRAAACSAATRWEAMKKGDLTADNDLARIIDLAMSEQLDLAWNEQLHPRGAAGSSTGGRFVAAAGGAASQQKAPPKVSKKQAAAKKKLLAKMTPAQQAAYHQRFELRKTAGIKSLHNETAAQKKALTRLGLLGVPSGKAKAVGTMLRRQDAIMRRSGASAQQRQHALRAAGLVALKKVRTAKTASATKPAKPPAVRKPKATMPAKSSFARRSFGGAFGSRPA